MRSDRRSRPHAPYAGPSLIRFLASAAPWIGVLAALWGIAYAINGATQATAYVTVPITLDTLEDSSVTNPEIHLPAGVLLQPSGSTMHLRAWDATVAEELLSRADVVVLGIALALGAVLLRRLLLSILEGEPFRAGNPARIARLAALIALAGALTSLLPPAAAAMVLARLDLSAPLTTPVTIPYMAIAVSLLLLAMAEAFRRGGELADDVAATI